MRNVFLMLILLKNSLQAALEMISFPTSDAQLEMPKIVQPNNSWELVSAAVNINGCYATNCLGDAHANIQNDCLH